MSEINKSLKELNLKKDEILNIYQLESALPSARAEGEFQRTLGQIQEFIELLALGSFINPIINYITLNI